MIEVLCDRLRIESIKGVGTKVFLRVPVNVEEGQEYGKQIVMENGIAIRCTDRESP